METLKKMAVVLSVVIAASMAMTACGGSSDSGSSAAPAETTAAAAEEKKDDSKEEEKKDDAKDEEKKDEEKTEDDAKDEEKTDEEKPADTASKDKPAKKGKSVVAQKQEEAPEEAPAEDVAPSSELAEAVANTVWVGMDPDYNVYAMMLTDEEFSLMSDDGSEINGYWGVVDGDPNIYVFNDQELTDCFFVIPFTCDTENNLLILNDTIILTPTEATDAGAMAEEMTNAATACKVAAYLDGTYWAGAEGSSALALSLNGSTMSFYYVDAENGESTGDFYWSLDYNYLTLYDTEYNPVLSYGWNFADDGSWLSLSDAEGNEAVLTQVSQEDAANIVDYLHAVVSGEVATEGGDGEEAAEEEEYTEEEYEEEE